MLENDCNCYIRQSYCYIAICHYLNWLHPTAFQVWLWFQKHPSWCYCDFYPILLLNNQTCLYPAEPFLFIISSCYNLHFLYTSPNFIQISHMSQIFNSYFTPINGRYVLWKNCKMKHGDIMRQLCNCIHWAEDGLLKRESLKKRKKRRRRRRRRRRSRETKWKKAPRTIFPRLQLRHLVRFLTVKLNWIRRCWLQCVSPPQQQQMSHSSPAAANEIRDNQLSVQCHLWNLSRLPNFVHQ